MPKAWERTRRRGPIGPGPLGVSVWSIATTPSQSLGSELLTDGAMENWLSATDLTSWTESIAGASTVNREAAVIHGGTFAARLDVDGSNSLVLISQNLAVTTGDFVEMTVWAKANSGTPTLRTDLGATAVAVTISTVYALYRTLIRAPSVTPAQNFFRGSASLSYYVDDASAKKLTLNAQLTALSADMRLTQLYTLPGSPNSGTQIWVMPRISAFSTGNYWKVLLTYTGSQWNIDLFSVAAHTPTSLTNATNIGTTNGIRINCKGNLFDLQTTADGGANWTTRGTQVNNSLYNTATGYNVMATSDVTLGLLTADAAT